MRNAQIQGIARALPQHPGMLPIHDELLHRRTVEYTVRQRPRHGRCNVRPDHRCHALGFYDVCSDLLRLVQHMLQGPSDSERHFTNRGEYTVRNGIQLSEYNIGIMRSILNGVGRT